MNGPFRRALHLCAGFILCITLALPEVEAAIAEAWRVCRAIDDAADRRYEAEHGTSKFDEAVYDALLREEFGRASEELLATVEQYLAVGAAPWHLALPYGDVRLLPEDEDELPDDEAVLVLRLVQHLRRAASVDVEVGANSNAWRRLEAAARVSLTLRDTDLHGFSLFGSVLRAFPADFEAAVAADPDDPAYARIRAALGALDIGQVARQALRWTGAINLHAAETRPELARAHPVVERAWGHHLRDRAELHHGWADIFKVIERAPPGERGAALKAIRARPWAAAGHHTVNTQYGARHVSPLYGFSGRQGEICAWHRTSGSCQGRGGRRGCGSAPRRRCPRFRVTAGSAGPILFRSSTPRRTPRRKSRPAGRRPPCTSRSAAASPSVSRRPGS